MKIYCCSKYKIKQTKGITLISLVITVVVLLLLAAVTIGTVKDDGVIEYAKNTTEDYKLAQEEYELQTDILQWQSIGTGTLLDFMKNKYGINKVQNNTNESVIVELQSGNKYIVTEDGNVTIYTNNMS